MRQILKRSGWVLLAIFSGSILFLLITKIGDKGRGPLSDLTRMMSTSIARFEKKVTDSRASRSSALDWFNRYRYNLRLMATSDTIFLGAYDDRTAESYESIVELEETIGARLPIISIYNAWGNKNIQVFPMLRVQAIYDLGSLPMITWEPWLDDFDASYFSDNPKIENKNVGGLKKIASGHFDLYIEKWARDARSFGKPLLLRLGHEMNDPYRYPWGPQNNHFTDFIAAWRHVVDLFKKAGAYNVQFVWSPHPAYPYLDYYPGNAYVDWNGTTVLNYGNVASWSKWWSFDDVFRHVYKDFLEFKKPIVLCEVGSLATGGDRAEWFQEAFDSLPNRYPLVKAVVFYHNHSDFTTSYKLLDWSITQDTSVVNAIQNSFHTWGK